MKEAAIARLAIRREGERGKKLRSIVSKTGWTHTATIRYNGVLNME